MTDALYLVHCGYYDKTSGAGVFENHTNLFVVAATTADAKAKAKRHPEFKAKKMHVDGLQRIEAVDGFRLELTPEKALDGGSRILSINAWARS